MCPKAPFQAGMGGGESAGSLCFATFVGSCAGHDPDMHDNTRKWLSDSMHSINPRFLQRGPILLFFVVGERVKLLVSRSSN